MVRHAILWLGVLIFVTILDQFVSIKTQLLVIFGVLAAGGLLVAYGTIARNKWGINLRAVSCPRCSAPPPPQRPSGSRSQRLWGGWTCSACGTEVDKWGRALLRGRDAPILTGAEVRGASPVPLDKYHVEGEIAVGSIVLNTVWAWIEGLRMRLKIKRDLGRNATQADLTSIETWMKVDEAEQRNQEEKPLG